MPLTKIPPSGINTAALSGVLGAGTQTYSTTAALPSTGISDGTLAYVSQNSSLYVQSNSTWKRVYTGADSPLEVTSEPPTSALIDFTDVSVKQHSITLAATDPEGFPVTYGYAISPANSVNVQSVTNTNGVYSLQLTATPQTMGSAVFRATATDGLHIVSRYQTLNFVVANPISLSGGSSTSTVYTAPNGTVVTSSDTSYDNANYKMDWLFNGTTTAAIGSYWLTSGAATGTLTFNFSNSPISYLNAVTIYPRARDDTFTSITNIQVSTNGITWTDVPNTSMNVTSAQPYGYSQTFALGTSTHKYVRLNLSKSGSWGLSLDDVRFTGA